MLNNLAEFVLSEAASAASLRTGSNASNKGTNEQFLRQSGYYFDVKEDMVTKNRSSMTKILNLVKDEVVKKIEDYPGRLYYTNKSKETGLHDLMDLK